MTYMARARKIRIATFVGITALSIGVSASPAQSTAASAGPAISLNQFLEQVQSSHQGYQGAIATQHGDYEGSQEALLPFYSQLFANLQYTNDNRQTLVPAFEGTLTLTDFSQVGFKKLFDFGLQSQVYYGITQTTVDGISPLLVPQNSLYTSGITLQLTQSLWQNGFGRQDRATRRATEAQDLANSYMSSYQGKTILADAETRYWNLAVARELVIVQKSSSDRTIAIRDFNSKRARSHLIDESDLLTSEAQAKSKLFDLKTAVDNERTAARAFNSARGIESDTVSERLALPNPDEMEEIKIPVREALRDDVKAAEQSELAVAANSDVAVEKQLPTLNLTGTASTNGLDPNLGNSINDTFTSEYPYFSIGLNFSMPLDTGKVSAVKRAYAEQMTGAELTYRRRLFDQDNDWQDLVKKLSEAKERLGIAVDVEKAQKVKFQHEELRQKQGATTTYQVFQYEIDYLTSVLNRIQTQATILDLVAQMKTYGANYETMSGAR